MRVDAVRRRAISPFRILARGERCGLGVGGDIGQRIDARSAGKRVGGAVDVDGYEHRGVEPARDRRSIIERQVTIVVARHRDAHPSPLHQFVAKRLGEDQGQILLANLAGNAGRSRVAAAVAGIDHDDRPSLRDRRSVDAVVDRRRQVDGETGLRGSIAAATDEDEDERSSGSGRRRRARNGAPPSHGPTSYPPARSLNRNACITQIMVNAKFASRRAFENPQFFHSPK